MEVEHSRLLKFLTKSRRNKPEMAEAPEIPAIKIQKDFESPPNVESEVPRTHEIREFDEKNNSSEVSEEDKNTCSEVKVTGADFTLSPVITVTKKESTFTKGDVKLQKVTVTEDIAEGHTENGAHRVSREVESVTQTDRQASSVTVENIERRVEELVTDTMEGDETSQDEKKSKIPMSRLRQAVERVKKERQAQRTRGDQPRRSSIPILKEVKKPLKRDASLNFTPAVDDEFDKLYEEIIENKQKDVDDKLPSVTMEDPEKIETKFEEIIHAYDEDEHEKQTVSRVSKIPALRRKDNDGSSRLGAMIDRAKEKTMVTKTIVDGGFKVTASTIRTKRFSRGNSRSSETQVEAVETIDVKETDDNDVFDKETDIKAAPVKPARSLRGITKRIVADNKAGTENTEDSKQSTVTENLDKKDGTLNKTKRFTRTVSKETRERNLNKELSRNLQEIRREFRNRIEDARLDDGFVVDDHVTTAETAVKENVVTPVRTEIISRGISKDINEGQNMNSTETVTVEELDDGGTRTITTKTTENLVIGTPIVTEKIIRSINREISTDSQNNTVKGVTTIEEVKDEGGKKVTKVINVKENITGIPVKTERFTRGISREMGNIKPRSSSKEIITKAENLGADNKQEIKKETLKTEHTEKEGVKAGIPVYTRVTRSFSKGRIQNVEMSRTVEWKPADEVKTKNYSRSVSEKVTKKELKDAGKWNHGVTISEVTEVNDKPIYQNGSPKDPVLESKLKDTVKDIASKITTKKVTEYNTAEEVTNVEKTTYTLSSNIDLSVDRDFKASREIGTQMSIDGKPVDRNFKFVKEFGTQMSEEVQTFDSPFDRDFKLAEKRNFESKIDSLLKLSSNTEEDYVYSSSDGEAKLSREFGTQMSVVGKIVEKDLKISKEIGTQMSLDGTKQIQDNDFDKLSTNHIISRIVTEKSEIENSNLSKKDKDSDIAEVTVLKGNVSRLKDKIAKEAGVVSKKELEEELPKKKSVLSKIAIFESLEKEPELELPTRKIKCKYVPPNINRMNSADRPKIVDELLKEQTQSEPLEDTVKVEIPVPLEGPPHTEPLKDTDKVEINETYDEVIYRTEPVVKEYFPDIKQTNIETKEFTTSYLQQETNNFEIPTILPSIIDFKAQESQIESKTVDSKVQIQRERSIEMPTIFPAKINYEADIGKIKPGKINLNIWSTQVEINKSTVDKVDVYKEESLQDIAQTLPGKVDFNTYERHGLVSRVLPETIDFKTEENQVEDVTVSPAEVNVEKEDVTQTLIKRIDSLIADSQNGVNDISPNINKGYLVDDVTTLPATIDLKSYEIKSEIATTLPDKIDIDVKTTEPEFAKTLTAFGFTPVQKSERKPEVSQKEVSAKPKPGKINLGLWQTQVETNKTYVGKPDLKKAKDAEIAKALSGRVSFNNKPRRTETVQGNFVLNKREFKAEIAKTSSYIESPIKNRVDEALPGKIEFDFTENHEEVKPLLDVVDSGNNEAQESIIRTVPETINFDKASSQADVATILPETIEFSSSENQADEPKILTGKIEFEMGFENNESKAEISASLQDLTHFSTTDSHTETFTTFSKQSSVEKVGKLDLKAWEHQVEVNKTLVDKIDVVKGEHLEELVNTLPGKIDFIAYESCVGEAKSFQAPVDSSTDENKVEIIELEDDAEAVGYTAEVAQILPAEIEFDPLKRTPRFNALPMLMRLNSQENKVHVNEGAQGSNDRKGSIYKVDIPIESNPGETLSDPELVDEDPAEVKATKDSIIGSIKRKLYFITNKNSGQDSPNTPMNTPVPVENYDDNHYVRRTDELHATTYSTSDFGHKANEVKTVSSVTSTAADTYEITAETVEESYSYGVTDNSAKENEHNDDTDTAQNEVERPEDNFNPPPPRDYQYIEDTENDRIKINRNVTNENGFNFDIPRAGNALTRSAYGADDFKSSTEELRRAKSLAELDLGDVVQGQVKRILGRIKSVDFNRRESVKTEISVKEMPKKLSVWEKIALFEAKTARSQQESTTAKQTITNQQKMTTIKQTKKVVGVVSNNNEQIIGEFISAKTTYGTYKEMEYLTLSDGRKMPVLAVGTALVDKVILKDLIAAAIDMGYRAIDTGFIYGNEKEVGEGIKAKIDDGTVRREDLFIMSKLWSTFHRTDLVKTACQDSLTTMGLEYFDLYMIHNPMSLQEGGAALPLNGSDLLYSMHDYMDAWLGMEELVTVGLAKSIGVSNFNSKQIQRILDEGRLQPVVNQVESHPYLTQESLSQFCSERNITLSCFGVLGSKGTPAELKNSTTPVIDDAIIKSVAAGLNVTPAQLLIRYQIDSGRNVVVKTSSAAHLWENLLALNFTLDTPTIASLNKLNQNKRTFVFQGMGDTHRDYPFLEIF